MGLLKEQIAAAEAVQDTTARDAATAIRVVAGPGTGKSHAVEERTRWLIQDQQTPAGRIKVVSFTRASSTDLRARVHSTLTLEDVANLTCPPRTGPDPVRGFGPVRRESAWHASGTRPRRSSANCGRRRWCSRRGKRSRRSRAASAWPSQRITAGGGSTGGCGSTRPSGCKNWSARTVG